MNVLLIGSGGREHALAWKLTQSAHVKRLFVVPGNSGTAAVAKTVNVPLEATDVAGLVEFALRQQVDLAVVGPEAPLVAGVVDAFQSARLRIFGPTQAAAQLEGSKAFSKAFMQRHNIPTAQAATFTEYEEARDYLSTLAAPPVIKASGLAAGKGVIVPNSFAEADTALRSMLLEHRFGMASETVLLEERLTGPEVSVMAFCDGTHAQMLLPAQDHKRLLDQDQGPNTGGMGAFAPTPVVTPELLAEVDQRVFQPTLAGMAAEGTPYVGILYAGLMLTPTGIQVLEFNCRLGDPETQVVLPLLADDLVEVIEACLAGQLAQTPLHFHPGAAVTTVMAAAGYPDQPQLGDEITGIEAAEAQGCLVFHAGAKRIEERLVTAGGRVLNVTALGANLAEAAQRVYAGIDQIHFAGAAFRTDIGRR